MFRLDRNIGIAHNHETDPYKEYWKNQSIEERLKAANYLNSVAFNFSLENPPVLDRTVFSMRKLSE
jgi:hypothetical protein